jgi:hypothetical protein
MPPRMPNLVPELNEESRILLIGLVSSLVGKEDRLAEMANYKITPEMIPNPDGDMELQFCRKVLELCYRAAQDHLAPSKEFMMPSLNLTFGSEEAEKWWEWLISKRAIDAHLPGSVNSIAMGLFDWMTRRRLQIGAEALSTIANSPEGLAVDVYDRMQQVMHRIAPMKRLAPPKSMLENFDTWLKHLEEIEKLGKEGLEAGPRTPWPSVNKELTGWNKTELALLTAKTGYGKSQAAWLMAQHSAWTQGGFNVLFMHYEQIDLSIMNRFAASQFQLFPGDFKDTRLVKVSDPVWKQRFQAMRQYVEKAEAEKGHIWLVDGQKMDTTQIEAIVAEKRGISAKEGRELLVIHDYLDLIDASKLGDFGFNTTRELHAIIDFLHDDLGGQYDCYSLVLAQDDVNTDYVRRLMPYNSQRVYQRAQFYMRIERVHRAEAADPALNADGKPRQDVLGRDLLYHDIGEAESKSMFHIIKASDGQQGLHIPVRIWDGRFRIDELKLTPTEKTALQDRIDADSRKFARGRTE